MLSLKMASWTLVQGIARFQEQASQVARRVSQGQFAERLCRKLMMLWHGSLSHTSSEPEACIGHGSRIQVMALTSGPLPDVAHNYWPLVVHVTGQYTTASCLLKKNHVPWHMFIPCCNFNLPTLTVLGASASYLTYHVSAKSLLIKSVKLPLFTKLSLYLDQFLVAFTFAYHDLISMPSLT